MSQNNRINQQFQGFTLIELAIVILIIGVLMAGAFSAYAPYIQKTMMTKQTKKIENIQVALADYVMDDPNDPLDPADKRLPCPASTTAALTDPSYGVEQCITGAVGTCSNGVCIRAGEGGKMVLTGAVPFKTLGVASDEVLDAYNDRMTYAVTQNLTLANAMPTLTTSGAIKIVTEAGTLRTTAPFVVLSHGKNKEGAITASGTPGTPCSTGPNGDGENCNDDGVFRSANLGETNTGGANDYDDVLRFDFERSASGLPLGQCPAKEFMVGLDNKGPICQSLRDSGLVVDITTDKTTLSNACVDWANPKPEDSIPYLSGGEKRDDGGWQTVRWFATCPARFCKTRGYDDGTLREDNKGILIIRCTAFGFQDE